MIGTGTRVGKYEIVRRLGEPGQDGEVWEARKPLATGADRKEAIKFLHNLTPEARIRFDDEIKHLVNAQFKSAHLVEIFDCGVHSDGAKDIPYYAMKLLNDPMRLDTYLTSKLLEPSILLSMLREAVGGLVDLHVSLLRNHTDIKASNLLVSMEPEAKLYITDFGFVRERGEPIDPSRTWKNTSIQPPGWVAPDDTDVWQLGTTLRNLLKGTSLNEFSALTWLQRLVEEMAPSKNDTEILTAQQIYERLERRKNVSPNGVWGWRPITARSVAKLVATAYEYHDGPLTTRLLIDILIRERQPKLPFSNDDIHQIIDCDLPASAQSASAKSTELSPSRSEEIAKRILFGLPSDETHIAEAKEEWKYLKALIADVPARSPADVDEAVYRKYARAVIRQRHVQLSLWDAGVRFLTSGRGTRVYFCSGYDEFAVSNAPLGETDLRATAIESLKRGARFVFVVPPNTRATTSAQDFKKYVEHEAPNWVEQIEIKRVSGRRNSPTGVVAKGPEWMERGEYFTPGFRYVLFEEEDATKAVHDEGAFLVGLPHGTTDLFALQYSLDDRMTKDFLRWLKLVGAN